MKLILLSTPEFFVEEDKIISALFEEGLDYFHLRKPGSEPIYCERLLRLLPEKYHARIVTHEHYYLKDEFNLRGIHLNHATNPSMVPARYRGHISRSCHTLEEVETGRDSSDYVFLSPIFDSISHPENRAAFTSQQLHDATRAGIINKHVMAAGGITTQTLPLLRDYGFGGAVILGDLWGRFNIQFGLDFKEVITHFRALRAAAE